MIDEPNKPLETRPIDVASGNWKIAFLYHQSLLLLTTKHLETFVKQIIIPTHQVLTT